MKVSKTDFISFQECERNAWIKIHKREIFDKYPISDFDKGLMQMGNKVEEVARLLFPEGILIQGRGVDQETETKKLVELNTSVIFQAIVSNEKFLIASDVLKYNKENKCYDIYEIKMSSVSTEEDAENKDEPDEQYINDITFQVLVLESCGIKIGKKFLIELNKNYIRHGKLNISELFVIQDVTTEVENEKTIVKEKMVLAYNYLSIETEPAGHCSCYYKGRSSHCTTFEYSNPEVPKYSVHNLNRIGNSKKLLKNLLDANILKIEDVPEDFEGLLSKPTSKNPKPKPRKLNQIKAHKSQLPLMGIDCIKNELSKLEFPLYFLDYETYPTAIPIFDGYRPYQQIVFQYSLHVLKSLDSEPEHYDFIELSKDPAPYIAKSLKERIGNEGTMISWYKNFENNRAKELGEMLPEYKEFFEGVVNRTYDLMDIVENQHYVHPKFMGKSSIKFVLPALFPEMDYKKLEVKSGTDAIESYRQIYEQEIIGEAVESKKTAMLEYCKWDTLAMVKLWEYFNKLIY